MNLELQFRQKYESESKELEQIQKEYDNKVFRSTNDQYVSNDMGIVNFVRTNFDYLKNNEEELFRVYKQVIPIQRVFKELLTYEFLNFVPVQKCYTLDDLVNTTIEILKKFQGYVGGFMLEDNEWLICDSKSQRFNINENQIALVNTIEKKYLHLTGDIVWFIDNVRILVKQYIDTTNDLKIEYKIIDDNRHDICWVIFILEQNNYMKID